MSETGDSEMMEDIVPSEESEAEDQNQVADEAGEAMKGQRGDGDAAGEAGISATPAIGPGVEAEEAEPEETPEPAELPQEPEAEVPTEPSRMSQFLRSSLRWITAFVLVFALGVLATWLTRVRPQAQALRELRVERDSILARAEEIDSELLEAQEENSQLQTHVDELEASLEQAREERDAAQNHLELLEVLVDVSAAQLALAQEEPLQARAALDSSDDRLASLQGELSGEPGEQIQDLRERLALALESIGEDDFAAQRDLEVLTNTLLAVERLAFEE